MTKKKKTLMGLAPLLAAISISAQAEDAIKVKVPFQFVTAGKTMPAADYRVQYRRENGTVTLSSPGVASVTMLTNPDERLEAKQSSLRFRHAGDQWVLQEVTLGGTVQAISAGESKKQMPKVQPSREGTPVPSGFSH